MFALCLSALLVIQDPAGTPPAQQEAKEAAVQYEEWDDRKARDALKEFAERTKGKDVPMKARMEAVEMLARGRNKRLVDVLAKVVLTEKAITVRKAAADALDHQPEKETKRAIARLLGASELHEVPQVQASLVQSFGRAGYEPGKDWKVLDGLFEHDYAPERIPLQQALVALIKEQRELEALDLLVRNLGEPVPADPDDASNPPAEYWEARWKAWQTWRADVKDALLALTGQRFSTEAEARAWLRKNEAELRRKR